MTTLGRLLLVRRTLLGFWRLWGIDTNSLNYTTKRMCVWLFGAISFGYLAFKW